MPRDIAPDFLFRRVMNLKEIKDAARQAFRDQQLQDTEGGVPDAVSFCAGFLAGVQQEQENNSPNEALIKMLQDTVDSQKKQIAFHLGEKKAVIEYCYDHLETMWAARITGILLGCDFRDAKDHADRFFEYCEEEGIE